MATIWTEEKFKQLQEILDKVKEGDKIEKTELVNILGIKTGRFPMSILNTLACNTRDFGYLDKVKFPEKLPKGARKIHINGKGTITLSAAHLNKHLEDGIFEKGTTFAMEVDTKSSDNKIILTSEGVDKDYVKKLKETKDK